MEASNKSEIIFFLLADVIKNYVVDQALTKIKV